jgi:phage tail-like protein
MTRRESELPTPAPLVRGMPALFREPDPRIGDVDVTFIERFTAALDAVLAPVFCTLDNLPAYFDPETAPEHVLDWLAGWVGLELYERWPSKLRRTLIAGAVQLHNRRGTTLGVGNTVAIFADVPARQVWVEESGGVSSVARLDVDDGRPAEFTTQRSGIWMRVRVAIGGDRYARAGEVERVTRLVERVTARVKPAHVVLREVVVSA